MQLKIITHLIVLSYYLTSILGMEICPGGCYECEEEVWEEVPCDEILLNSTTILPPDPPYNDTTPMSPKTSLTTTQQPETTTTILTTTAIPETTTLTPTTFTTTPTTIITTSTTPKPTETTKPKYDSFKKCYCECKVGCKEFCRKVVVNPEPEKQILQLSKITEPVAQGQIELTHYHQRELKTNTVSNRNHGSYSSGSVSQPPVAVNNNSSNTETYKYQASTPTPQSHNYEEKYENSLLPVANTDKSNLDPVQPIPYAHGEQKPTTDFSNNNGTYTSDTFTLPPTAVNNNYSNTETLIYQAPTPTLPLINYGKEEHNIVNNENAILPVVYYDKTNLYPVQPIPYSHAELKANTAYNKNYGKPPITNNYSNIKYKEFKLTPPSDNYVEKLNIINNENSVVDYGKTNFNPVQPIAYAHAKAGFKNINSYSSSQNQPLIKYYTAPNSATYDFPIPFGNIYSKITKTILGPTDSAQISIAPIIPNSKRSYSNRPCDGYSQPTYLSPTPAKSSQLETPVSLSTTLNYDDSFDKIIKEFMSHNPSNDASYESYSSPYYSLTYSSS